MASKYRTLFASRLRHALRSETVTPPSVRKIAANSSLVRTPNKLHPFALRLPVRTFQNHTEKCLSDMVENFETDEKLPSISISPSENRKSSIEISLPQLDFTRQCVNAALREDPQKIWLRNSVFPDEEDIKNVIVEYSSPNVAKPFHVGHLRSTIIGSFCANICEVVGHRVTRLNWIGDWGTQFGLLTAGIEDFGLDLDGLGEDAIKKLYEVYVKANKKAEEDKEFGKKALEMFAKLEGGNENLMGQWKKIREVSVAKS